MNTVKGATEKAGRKLLLKIIGWIGLPAFLFLLLIAVVMAAVAGQLIGQSSAIAGAVSYQQQYDQRKEDLIGKATYVGVNDIDTAFSRRILDETAQWTSPYRQGYGGQCELWCSVVYHHAGLPYNGTCCAYNHSTSANKAGAIPKGALIFSGIRPNGTMYENNHRESAWCDVCGHYAGHVAIYIGNGMVAGAQVPYLQSLDAWIEVYGYGGWSTE